MLIKEVFKEFLNEQKNNLSKKTFDEYKSVIELFADSLHGYAWNNIDDCDEAYNKAESKKLEFVDLYDHTHVLSNVREFVDYFVPRKVMAGDEFKFKIVPRVARKLLKWMRDKNLINLSNEEITDYCENQSWEDSLEEMGFI